MDLQPPHEATDMYSSLNEVHPVFELCDVQQWVQRMCLCEATEKGLFELREVCWVGELGSRR